MDKTRCFTAVCFLGFGTIKKKLNQKKIIMSDFYFIFSTTLYNLYSLILSGTGKENMLFQA